MGRTNFVNLTAEEFADRTMIGAILGWMPNSIYYVSSTDGASTNDGYLRSSPLATLAQAVAKLSTASGGDCVIMLPGHAETLSTTTQGVLIATTGCAFIGFGNARNRPTLTCGAADIKGVSVSGTSNYFRNFRIISSTSQTSKASTLLHFSGADNVADGLSIEHGTTGGIDGVSLTGAARSVIKNCTFLGTGTAAQVAIQVRSNLIDGVIDNNTFNYGVNRLKSATVFASLGSNCSGTNITNNKVTGQLITFLDIVGSIATNTTAGMCSGNRICYGGSITLLSSASTRPGDLGVMDQHEVDGKRIQPTVYGLVSIHPSSVINVHAAIMHT